MTTLKAFAVALSLTFVSVVLTMAMDANSQVTF